MGSPKKVTTGYRYHGGIAQAICAGPVDTLHTILNGDTVIWEGPVHRASADADGKTVLNTSLGAIRFYWGLDTQSIDPDLARVQIDYGGGPVPVPVPPWRGVCYVVSKRLEFGQQNSPPILHFDLTRRSTGLNLSEHEIGGDAVLPEVIFEYLTNPIWGLGISEGDIDIPSFVTAAETVIAEGIGVSPTCDSATTMREFVGQLLSYIDGVLVYQGGKLAMKLIRKESTAGLPALNDGDLIDEPKPSNECFGDTWNLTRVSFTDRENKYEQGVESYDDPANADIVGETASRDFNFPFVKTRAVAKRLAKRLGIKGGVPALSWQLELKPKWHGLTPGSLVFLLYSKLGIENRLLRLTHVRVGSVDRPGIEVEAVEENSRDSTHDYLPPQDNFSVPAKILPDGSKPDAVVSTAPRVSWLPDALKEGKADGMLVACHRPDGFSTLLELWWTYDPAQLAFSRLEVTTSFPAKGTLLSWHRIRGSHWLLRVKMDSELDYNRLLDLTSATFYVVVGQRLFRRDPFKDQHQVMALWLSNVVGGYVNAGADRVIDLELAGGAFGTPDLAFEGEGADGRYPTGHVYFGRVEDFLIHRTDAIQFERPDANAPIDPATGESYDNGLVRYLRTPVGKPKRIQQVSDAAQVTYDRDGASMCPDGTFSRDWGSRVLTAYEQLDLGMFGLEDLDEALGKLFDGTATAEQALIAGDVNLLLGAVTATNSNRYAP
jgi:hypothetical protein